MSAQAPPVSAVRAQKLTRYSTVYAQALMDQLGEVPQTKAGTDVYLAEDVDRVLAERDEEARMGHVRLDECSDMADTGHLTLYDRIGLKLQKNAEQRAEIEARYPKLPAHINEWLAKIAADREELDTLKQETRALREALAQMKLANQTTLSTLADIGYSDDMTLAVARKKAKRVYQGVANALVESASPGAQKET